MRTLRAGWRRVVLAGLGSAVPGLAWAQGGLFLLDPPPEQQPSLSVGGGLLAYPAYPGSASLRLLPLPAFEWLAPNGLFASTEAGLGWNASTRADLQAGIRLLPVLGRTPDSATRVAHLPGIPLQVERTLFANWQPAPWAQVQSALRTGLAPGGQGVLAELGGSAGLPLAEHWLGGVTLGMSWGNGAWRQAIWGISASQAQASGLPVFTAGPGWQDLQLTFGAEWTMAPGLRLTGRLERTRLLGAAAASPLTESRWQTGGALTLWRDFAP